MKSRRAVHFHFEGGTRATHVHATKKVPTESPGEKRPDCRAISRPEPREHTDVDNSARSLSANASPATRRSSQSPSSEQIEFALRYKSRASATFRRVFCHSCYVPLCCAAFFVIYGSLHNARLKNAERYGNFSEHSFACFLERELFNVSFFLVNMSELDRQILESFEFP